VAKHPGGTVFHTTTWLEQVADDIRVSVAGDGTIQGGIALARFRKLGQLGYHIPPYTPYGGPLAGEASRGFAANTRSSALIEQLIRSVSGAAHLDFTLPPEPQDILPYSLAGCDVSAAVTHRLRENGVPLLQRIESRSRTYLQRLSQLLAEGEITATWDDSYDEILEIWSQTGDRKGFATRHARLSRMVSHLGTTCFRSVMLRTAVGEPLAGQICAKDSRTYYNLIPAINKSATGLLGRAGLLSCYLMINDAWSTGRVFDFEGSSIRGVAEFYRRMGGERLPVFRVQRTRSPYYAALRAIRHLKTAWA